MTTGNLSSSLAACGEPGYDLIARTRVISVDSELSASPAPEPR